MCIKLLVELLGRLLTHPGPKSCKPSAAFETVSPHSNVRKKPHFQSLSRAKPLPLKAKEHARELLDNSEALEFEA